MMMTQAHGSILKGEPVGVVSQSTAEVGDGQ